MRFLCLHGMGTNNQIFETQLATIRNALGDAHTFVYVEGVVPWPMAPGFQGSNYSRGHRMNSFATPMRRQSLMDLMGDGNSFDGVMAFSEGAALAASLMIWQLKDNPATARLHPLFRCAIFFSGGVPFDVEAVLKGQEVKELDPATAETLIQVPTVHIWGANDQQYPHFGPVLYDLCDKSCREKFIHSGQHDIPGAKQQEDVAASVKLIRRCIEKVDLAH